MELRITKNDAAEIQHKLGILSDEPDLQADYGLTHDQANELYESIPLNGGIWIVPEFAEGVVKGELADHANVLSAISAAARSHNEIGQSLRIARQAKRFSDFSE